MIRSHGHSFLFGVLGGLLLARHVWLLALVCFGFGLALGRLWWLLAEGGRLLRRRFEGPWPS